MVEFFKSTHTVRGFLFISQPEHMLCVLKRMITLSIQNTLLNRNMRFGTMRYVRPAKPQISLCIRAV